MTLLRNRQVQAAVLEPHAQLVWLKQAPTSSSSFARTASSTTTEDRIRSIGRKCARVDCDLTLGRSELERAFAEAERVVSVDWEKSNGIQILVNAAGIQHRCASVEFSEVKWDEVMEVNLKSVFLLCQLAGKHMIERKYGKIINFASLLSFQGGYTVPAYAASKAAIASLTKSFTNEWAAHNININAIASGYIETDMNTDLLKDPIRLQQINDRIPARRWGAPSELVGPVVFLASEASRYVNGTLLTVDGGWMGR